MFSVCFSGRLATPWDLLTGGWPVRSPDIRVTPVDTAVRAFLAAERAADACEPCTHYKGCSLSSQPPGSGWPHLGPGRPAGGERLRTAGEVARDPSQGLALPVFGGAGPRPTSTKASVRSLARSITGKWRPATIFTFSFPGIVSASASSSGSCRQKQASLRRAPSPGGDGRERGERACARPRGRAGN